MISTAYSLEDKQFLERLRPAVGRLHSSVLKFMLKENFLKCIFKLEAYFSS